MHHLWEDDVLVVYQGTAESSISNVLHSDRPRALGRHVGRVFQLMHLWVPETQRHRGIGSHLLRTLYGHCAAVGVRRIDVDDMSERFTHPRNVYLNNGFVYRRSGYPEMYASVHVRDISVRPP